MDGYANSAVALLIGERVFLQAYLPTTVGLSVGAGPVHSALNKDSVALSDAIRKTFALPSQTLDHPSQSDWARVQAPMLEATGFKSWGAMAKRSKAVGLERNQMMLRMTPSADYANHGGQDLPDAAVEIALADERRGEALCEAFERCC